MRSVSQINVENLKNYSQIVKLQHYSKDIPKFVEESIKEKYKNLRENSLDFYNIASDGKKET